MIAALGFLVRSVVGRYALAALALLIVVPTAYHAWRWNVAREASAAAMARALVKTQSESDRRMKALDAARTNAERAQEALADALADRMQLMGEIDALSRANDDRVCIDADSVQRLDAIRGRPPGPGAGKSPR